MNWNDVVKLAELALTVAAAAGGTVGIVALLKKYLKLDGVGAQIASWVVTAVMGLLSAIVAGQINPDIFTNWVDTLTIVVMVILNSITSGGVYRAYKATRA